MAFWKPHDDNHSMDESKERRHVLDYNMFSISSKNDIPWQFSLYIGGLNDAGSTLSIVTWGFLCSSNQDSKTWT